MPENSAPHEVSINGNDEFGQPNKEKLFRDELRSLLNRYSRENNSNTPDFILADVMLDALNSYESAVNRAKMLSTPEVIREKTNSF